jgi:hypothetical protein
MSCICPRCGAPCECGDIVCGICECELEALSRGHNNETENRNTSSTAEGMLT